MLRWLGDATPRLTHGVAVGSGLAVVLLAGCGSAAPSESAATGGSELQVTAAFYPLEYVSERIGGDAVNVSSLTQPGVEPHDLELTPRDLAELQGADLVVYLSGFQPAVDEAVTQASDVTVLDAADSAGLDLTYTPIEDAELEQEASGSTDPHFWLDPKRLSDVAAQVAAALEQARPEQAAVFERNLAALRADLDTLDTDLRKGLSDCASTDLVTSHNAFGYLAQAYGLDQIGITGLSPAAEPDPRQLAEIVALVEERDVRTIYGETLVSPAVAESVAAESGARTAVLDPVEGVSAESAGDDYLEIMRANLATLQEGQPCP